MAETETAYEPRMKTEYRQRIRKAMKDKFAYTNEFGVPGGRLGSMASRFIVGATSEREAHSSLARLKALLERP